MSWQSDLDAFTERLRMADSRRWASAIHCIIKCIEQPGALTAPTPERACTMLRCMAELKAEFIAECGLGNGFDDQLAGDCAVFLYAAKLVDGGCK